MLNRQGNAAPGWLGRTFRVVTMLLLAWSPTATAEDRRPVGLAASLGYSDPGQAGLGYTVGAWVRFAPVIAFATLDMTLVDGPANERYASETFSDGRSTCRDLTSGEFARKSECGSGRTLVAGMLEVHFRPVPQLFLGAGLRSPPAPGPYVALGYLHEFAWTSPFLFLRGALGKNFGQAHFGLGF